ncbi:MAG: hypothetical protein IAF38_03750 [Bacteroidia bacterium]|nr:hypothetical protein [Bacteroidia bacterium]
MNRKLLTLLSLLLSLSFFAKDYHDLLNQENAVQISRVGNNDLTVKMPDFIFENTNSKIELQFVNPANPKLTENNYQLGFILNGQEIPVTFDKNGHAVINHKFQSGDKASLLFEDLSYTKELNIISLWMIIVPVAFVALLIILRVLNQKAKNKIAKKNRLAIDAKKIAEAKSETKTTTIKVSEVTEEEIMA